MTDWTQPPPPRSLGGRMRAAGRGAESMLAAELDAAHLLAEHLALVETYKRLRDAAREAHWRLRLTGDPHAVVAREELTAALRSDVVDLTEADR